MTAPTRALGPAFRAPDPRDFVARTEPLGLGEDPPPFRLDERAKAAADGGHLIAGREKLFAGSGTAAVLELPSGLEDIGALRRVAEWLRAVEPFPVGEPPPGGGTDGDAGGRDPVGQTGSRPPVVALGAFPFDRSAPARLVVPSSLSCRSRDGRSWRIVVERRDRSADHRERQSGRAGPDGSPFAPGLPVAPGECREVPTGAGYEAAVAAALHEIERGSLRKVVLSRSVEIGLSVAKRPSELLEHLWGDEDVFAPFSIPIGSARLVGASPELIVGRHGDRVESHAFAGTIGLPPGAGRDAAPPTTAAPSTQRPAERLLESAKDRSEHRLAVEEVAAVLARRCSELDVPREPAVVLLRSDARLGTLVRGVLRDPGEATVLTLLSLLHPTPAVGGVPRGVALKAISALEARPRGYWAGVAGWIDADGDGEWVLTIRSAILGEGGTAARVSAGAGVVEGSSPSMELAETTLKLAPVIEALSPGTIPSS